MNIQFKKKTLKTNSESTKKKLTIKQIAIRSLVVFDFSIILLSGIMWGVFIEDVVLVKADEYSNPFEQCKDPEFQKICSLDYVDCNCPIEKIENDESDNKKVLGEQTEELAVVRYNNQDLYLPTFGQRAATTRICSKMGKEYESKLRSSGIALKDFENICYFDLLGMASAESSFNCAAIGDSGTALGCFQIRQVNHPEVDDACVKDYECSAEHSLKWMLDYKWSYPVYRTRAIASHNGGPNGYLIKNALIYTETVKNRSNSFREIYKN